MSARVAGDDGLVEAIRARRDLGKESILRDMAQDARLTMKARGVLLYLLSKPDKWRTSAASIAGNCEKDGRESIANGLRELEQLGYLVRLRRHRPDGRWQWSWVYSDDPTEVAEVVEELKGGAAPVRGRARRTTKAQVVAIDGFPVDGATSPQVSTSDGFPVDGKPADGSAAHGKPADIENQELEIPPKPPAERGADAAPAQEEPPAGRPRCAEHGIAGCRACKLSVRSAAMAERDAEQDAERAELAARASCPGRMCCPQTGTRWDPATHVPLSPARKCDHRTPHHQVLAEIAAAEAAEEAVRAARRPAPVVTSSAEARRRARELVAASCRPPEPRRKRGAAARPGQDGGTTATPDGVSSAAPQVGDGVAGRETAAAGV